MNEGKFHHSSTVSQEIGGVGVPRAESKAEPHGVVRKVPIKVLMFAKGLLKSVDAMRWKQARQIQVSTMRVIICKMHSFRLHCV